MPREMEKTNQSIEPEQIVGGGSDGSGMESLEIHTIPDKFYGAAMRASLEAAKAPSGATPSQPVQKSSGQPKKKSSLMFIIIGIVIVLLGSAGGFVYFNQSLLFGKKDQTPAPVVQQPPSLPTPPPVPSAPTNLSATATSQTVVQLNWTDTSSNEAGFRVERREPTSQFVPITSLPPNSSAYQDRSVVAQKDYLYRIVASNEGGDSAPSNETAAQTPAELPPPPEPAKLPPAGLDTDSDGLSDIEESLYGTNVNDPDTDHDSFLDGNEVFHLYNPASGVNAKLLETGLVKTLESPIGWSLYVPVSWKTSVSNDGMSAKIETGRGETFVISMHRNKDRKSVMDWYLADHPGVLSSQVIPINTKSGFSGLESENKLHTYFAWDDWVLDFQYDLDGQPFVNFRQTYEMMKNSLKLSTVPLISPELTQSFEQKEAADATANQTPASTSSSSTNSAGSISPPSSAANVPPPEFVSPATTTNQP